MRTIRRRVTVALGAAGLIVAGAGGIAGATTAPTEPATGDSGGGAVDYMWTPNPDVLAGAEGEVNIIAWAGYVEDGSTDPAVDWVTPFEDLTGCAVNVQARQHQSDEMVQLMQSGEYDGVSASGDATERLIAGDEVGPIDVAEFAELRRRSSTTSSCSSGTPVDGEPYGIPHGRGANLLVYNTEAFADAAPDSWSVMFDGGTPADGTISVYDSPIYIADAAVYLMATQPDLGITNPYALDADQFDAAIALLEQQKPLDRPVLGALHRPADRARGRHRARRHDVAVHRQPGPGQRCHDRRAQAGRRCDRMVRHLDAVHQGRPPQLHEAVDGLDHVAVGQRPGRRVVRRGARQP